jgi:hypothetical protein
MQEWDNHGLKVRNVDLVWPIIRDDSFSFAAEIVDYEERRRTINDKQETVIDTAEEAGLPTSCSSS